MKRLVWFGGFALLLVLGMWWFSPTQKMKRRVSAMIQTANVPSSMGDLARKTRGTNLADYLAPQLEISEPEKIDDRIPRRISRDSAAATYTYAATAARQISLQDLEIDEIEFDDTEATVKFRLDAIVELPTRTPVNGILHVISIWEDRPNEGWRLKSLAWEEKGR